MEKKKPKSGVIREIEIADGVEAKKEGRVLTVKGPKGEIKREFSNPKIKTEIKGNKIILSSDESRRKTKAVLGTWAGLIKNMISGVTKQWKCEMKLVFSHFPAKMSFKDSEFVVQNFLGERSPRSTKLTADVNVKVDKENITITGIDKEKVGQAAGKIEGVTRIVGFDRRIFQDGCYITKKPYLE